MNLRLDATVAALPQRYPGPGGALAVLRRGEVLARHSWGWADVERRLAFTTCTPALICSITKQFTCALVLDQFSDPTVLDADVRRHLPALLSALPTTLQLCHNQSGLRDYWALAMLCGAAVEREFGPAEARRLIGRAQSPQFEPGSSYSYANQNFRILSDIVEERTGKPYAALLRGRLFDRAGMPHAELNPDTSHVVGGAIGYEGSLELGFRPAVNRIHWTGDAGIAASLDDMIAWERFIDATHEDPDSLYCRLAAPVAFADGAPASYGFGLVRAKMLERPLTCHGGGLRGWRSFRFYAPAERVSVVVLFNHMADPHDAALDLFAAVLDAPAPNAPQPAPPPGWDGRFLEPQTGLATRIEASERGLRLHYSATPEMLTPGKDGTFVSAATRLTRVGDAVRMERPGENMRTALDACVGDSGLDIEGVFHNAELAATLTCVAAGGELYGAFSGELGHGAMQPLLRFGPDVWLLPCPRALDYNAPGDWTLAFRRDPSGAVAGVRVGCWLARQLDFARAG